VTLRCLIVDDNPRYGDEARRLLECEGVEVVGVAASGEDAVRLMESLAPELALVDISLGAESGFDVARRLAEGPNGSALVIIFVSSHDGDDFSDRIVDSPAVGFIPKTQLSAERIRDLIGD
jgi:two-component system, NarL family, nitrate/nitrite response regulator NarL